MPSSGAYSLIFFPIFPHGKQGRSPCSLFFRIGKDETDIEQILQAEQEGTLPTEQEQTGHSTNPTKWICKLQ